MGGHARRLLAAVAASLLGFAPAPFPKPDRDRPADSPLPLMQGTWRAVCVQHRTTDGLKSSNPPHRVLISNNRYVFYDGERAVLQTYNLDVAEVGWPRCFRLTRGRGEDLVGVVAARGNEVQLLYRPESLGDVRMPKNLKTIPVGWFLMTLERDDRR